MSRKIDFSKPLDPSDYDYLAARPWLYRGQSIEDLEFADGEHDADTDSNDEDDDPIDDSDDNAETEDDESDEDEELDDEDGEEEDLDEEDEDEEEEDEEDLDDLTAPQLKDLAKERGLDVPRGAKKEDLVDLLS